MIKIYYYRSKYGSYYFRALIDEYILMSRANNLKRDWNGNKKRNLRENLQSTLFGSKVLRVELVSNSVVLGNEYIEIEKERLIKWIDKNIGKSGKQRMNSRLMIIRGKLL